MQIDLKISEFRNSAESPWTYSMLDQYQRTRTNEIVFSELAPVITLGQRARDRTIGPTTAEQIRLDRGGLETWHGPGQMVVFPVLDMITFFGSKLALKKAVHSLLEITLRTVLPYQPTAHIEFGDRLGIWTQRGKLVSIGISIKEGKLYHGVAINLTRTPESFQGINPCGIENAVPDFCNADFSSLKQSWVRNCLALLVPRESRLELISESLYALHVSDPLVQQST